MNRNTLRYAVNTILCALHTEGDYTVVATERAASLPAAVVRCIELARTETADVGTTRRMFAVGIGDDPTARSFWLHEGTVCDDGPRVTAGLTRTERRVFLRAYNTYLRTLKTLRAALRAPACDHGEASRCASCALTEEHVTEVLRSANAQRAALSLFADALLQSHRAAALARVTDYCEAVFGLPASWVAWETQLDLAADEAHPLELGMFCEVDGSDVCVIDGDTMVAAFRMMLRFDASDVELSHDADFAAVCDARRDAAIDAQERDAAVAG